MAQKCTGAKRSGTVWFGKLQDSIYTGLHKTGEWKEDSILYQGLKNSEISKHVHV